MTKGEMCSAIDILLWLIVDRQGARHWEVQKRG